MTPRSARLIAVAAAIAIVPGLRAHAQTPTSAAPPAATAGFDFSGVIFGNWQIKTDSASKANLGGSSPNLFDLGRAYLTFKMPAGDNGAIRITTDVFQNTNPAQNAYYQGWVIRAKYAYLQYTGLKNEFGPGSSLVGRLGLLHTVIIDWEEQLWPRYLQNTAIEKNGFFSSSDMGLAGIATLGNRWGEIYGTVTNGSGYASYDNPGAAGQTQPVGTNRFKDFGLRASITPWGHDTNLSTYVRNISITPWGYLGCNGSAFQSGGAGQVGPGTNGAITDCMSRNRFGVFAAIKDSTICDFRNGGRCRLTAGLQFAQRQDQSDNGGNTVASPRVQHDSTGRLLDGFFFIRPVEVFNPSEHSPFSLVARFDHFTPQTDPSSSVPGAANYAGTTPAYNFWVLGASYDVNQKITLTADYQNQTPTDFPIPTGTNVRPTPTSSIFFVHFVVNF
jgi:hypothetical protein